MDNGSELIERPLVDWWQDRDIETRNVQPTKSDQNTSVERFSRPLREEVLSTYLFEDLD